MNRSGLLICVLIVGLTIPVQPSTQPVAAESVAPRNADAERFFELGLDGADWIGSFQVTDPRFSWGIPYPAEKAWGLDPFYYSNGTITAETGSIQTGEKQSLAYLIGGHDAGLGAQAALNAYIWAGDERYLKVFQVYYDYFRRSQIPNPFVATPAQTVFQTKTGSVPIYDSGYWAEQANLQAGADGEFGTADDNVTLAAIFPSAEHGNPIAASLLQYYYWSNDSVALVMLNRYGNWLINSQIKGGEYSGAFPVTQAYFAAGWKPRMYETSESAWVLAELYRLTGNRTYLQAAKAAGDYMVSRQLTGRSWNDPRVDGALPYEGNGTRYSNAVSTNHAGFTLLAWAQLFRFTNNTSYLRAAEKYAKWLLSFQVTPSGIGWGDHTYAADEFAVGGFYYGYNPETHEFGWRVAESLWSASHAIRGLLLLSQITNNDAYLQSAALAANWLAGMRFPDSTPVPLQALTTIKYVRSSWWGRYAQFYQPDIGQIEEAGMTGFVDEGSTNSSKNASGLTWFERTFHVDFNRIDYEMASRGPRFMKMIWGWWPDVGFEPRYGGDVAFGAFTLAYFREYQDLLAYSRPALTELDQLKSRLLLGISPTLTQTIAQGEQLHEYAERLFREGWYSAAYSKLQESARLVDSALNSLREMTRNQQIAIYITVGAVVLTSVAVLINKAGFRGRPRRPSRRMRRRTGESRSRRG